MLKRKRLMTLLLIPVITCQQKTQNSLIDAHKMNHCMQQTCVPHYFIALPVWSWKTLVEDFHNYYKISMVSPMSESKTQLVGIPCYSIESSSTEWQESDPHTYTYLFTKSAVAQQYLSILCTCTSEGIFENQKISKIPCYSIEWSSTEWQESDPHTYLFTKSAVAQQYLSILCTCTSEGIFENHSHPLHLYVPANLPQTFASRMWQTYLHMKWMQYMCTIGHLNCLITVQRQITLKTEVQYLIFFYLYDFFRGCETVQWTVFPYKIMAKP